MPDVWHWLRSRQGMAVVGLTIVTVLVVGGAFLVMTNLTRPVASRTPGIPSPSPQTNASPTFLSSPSPSPTPSPSPAYSPSPAPSSGIPTTGPATMAYPPYYPASTGPGGSAVPALTLNCRLPVYVGPSGSGGFIVFPGGTFVADPSSAVTLPTPAPGSPSPLPSQGPYGPQNSAFSYDAAFARWLPVTAAHVSPDGARYAFAASEGIYVVDVATGSLSTIGGGQAWSIVGVQASGVYAMQPGKSGLWIVPFSGSPRQITAQGFWQAVTAGSAYGSPTSAVPQGVANEIIRVDLASGAVSPWFLRPSAQSFVVGADAGGAAIVSVSYFGEQYNYATEVWIVGSAGKGVPVLGNSAGNGVYVTGSPMADANGVWFPANYNYYGGGVSGFVLYVPHQGVFWMSNVGAQLGAGCIQR